MHPIHNLTDICGLAYMRLPELQKDVLREPIVLQFVCKRDGGVAVSRRLLMADSQVRS
jgi:hypothetical protein